MTEWLLEMGARFTVEDYIIWSRLQGSAWTLADLIIVFNLLRIANLCRAQVGERKHRWSFYILYATIPFALLIPMSPNHIAFFRLELCVTIPHFLLILYVLFANLGVAPRALHHLVTTRPATP